jgi:mannose-6-phosphate isomerase-like protein (cupin superfamily)
MKPIEAEGLSCQNLFSPDQIAAHIGTCWLAVQPKGRAKRKGREDCTAYVVYDGGGAVEAGETRKQIRPLDCFFVPAGLPHAMEAGDTGLTLFSFWFRPKTQHIKELLLTPWQPNKLRAAHQETFFWYEAFPKEQIGALLDNGWGMVKPGLAVELHSHPTAEVYIYMRGKPIQQLGWEVRPVGPGVAVFVPADTLHSIINAADSEAVLFWFEYLPGTV